jgi:hypothetical protein
MFYAFDHVTLSFIVFKLLTSGSQVVQVIPDLTSPYANDAHV